MKKIWKYGKFSYESAKHLRKFAKKKFWRALRSNYKSRKNKALSNAPLSGVDE